MVSDTSPFVPGVVVATLTPFTMDGMKVDEDRLSEHVRFLSQAEGVTGLLVNGSAGEVRSLSVEERQATLRVAVEAAGDRLRVFAGCGVASSEETIQQGKEAKELGATGWLVLLQGEWPLTEMDAITHYRELSNAVDLPLLVYHAPALTHVDLGTKTLQMLAADGVIWGVKETSGELKRIIELKINYPSSLTVFAGSDVLGFPGALLGVDGWMSSLANLFPAECGRLFALARDDEGSLSEAAALYRWLMRARAAIESTNRTVAALKQCSAILHRDMGTPRRPLQPLSTEQTTMLADELAGFGG